jgi:DNA repair protein RecO (recombination protein O)
MRTFSSEGIILKRVDFGEADKLVTIFTKNKGKITSLAKGIRRIESRRSGNVDLLNKAKLFFAESKSLPILTEAESLETYKDLKKDLKKVGHAYYLAELVDQFFHDQQESYKTFELLSESLGFLDQLPLEKSENIVRAFEIKILSLAGYRPQLFSCVKCRKPIEPDGNIISPEVGGLVHASCANDSLFAKPISQEAIKVLRFVQGKHLSEVAKLGISDKLARDLREIMKFYLEFVLEKQLASADFTEKVKKLE